MSDLQRQPLTEDLMNRITAQVHAGLALTDAAKVVRLNPLTLNQWLRRGAEGLRKGIPLDDPTEGLYLRLRQELDAALAGRRLRLLKGMNTIAFDDKTEMTERVVEGKKLVILKPATSPGVRLDAQKYLLERSEAMDGGFDGGEVQEEESLRVRLARQSGDPDQLREALLADRQEEDLLLTLLYRAADDEPAANRLSSDP